MIQVVLVVLLISIISGVFIAQFKIDPINSDIKYLAIKINEKRNNALKYSHVNKVANWEDFNNYNNTCINLDFSTEKALTGSSQMLSSEVDSESKYNLSVNTISSVSGLSSTYSKVCFDANGVPYDGDYHLNNIVFDKITVTLMNSKSRDLYIMPFSGTVVY